MVYQFKKGSRITADPNVAAEMLQQLDAEGRLTAKNLVDVNRPKNAPLHNEFEWDNKKAAEAYRENQARHIINSLEVVVEEKPPVRAYFNIEYKSSEYRHIDAILREENSRHQLLRNAYNEMSSFKRKYTQLAELCGVIEAIDDAQVHLDEFFQKGA